MPLRRFVKPEKKKKSWCTLLDFVDGCRGKSVGADSPFVKLLNGHWDTYWRRGWVCVRSTMLGNNDRDRNNILIQWNEDRDVHLACVLLHIGYMGLSILCMRKCWEQSATLRKYTKLKTTNSIHSVPSSRNHYRGCGCRAPRYCQAPHRWALPETYEHRVARRCPEECVFRDG
jgi:hypothetical protein